jgi:hypothetical protein
VIELIQRHRSRGLPSPVDADVLARAGISPSLIPRTLQSMIGLDLITEKGELTPLFEGIRKAPEAEYKQHVLQWLNTTYADVLAFADPATDDETKIRDAFRQYKPYGQQERMVTLFLKLYAHAGVATKPAINPPPRTRPVAAKPKPAAQRQDHADKLDRRHAGGHPIPGVPPALAGMLLGLPSEEAGWSQDQRDKFHAAFGAMLDFCFPIVEAKGPPASTETAPG